MRRRAVRGWLWDRWDAFIAPVDRFLCMHLDIHGRGCRGRTYCRAGWPR